MSHYYNPSSLWEDTEALISRRDREEEDEFDEPKSRRSIYASRDDDEEDEEEEEEPSEDDLKETEAEVRKLGPLNHVAGEDDSPPPAIPVPTIQKVNFSSNGNGSKPKAKLSSYTQPVFRQINSGSGKEAVMTELKAATAALAAAVERHRVAKLKAIRYLIH